MKVAALFLILIVLSNTCRAEEPLVPPRVSLDEATRQLLKESNKRVLGASTEIIDGKEIHIIKVLTPDGHIQHYKIDAETGSTISQ
jgi:uncharacterized membrane protein YkoI